MHLHSVVLAAAPGTQDSQQLRLPDTQMKPRCHLCSLCTCQCSSAPTIRDHFFPLYSCQAERVATFPRALQIVESRRWGRHRPLFLLLWGNHLRHDVENSSLDLEETSDSQRMSARLSCFLGLSPNCPSPAPLLSSGRQVPCSLRVGAG